jgi:hypothetical protein
LVSGRIETPFTSAPPLLKNVGKIRGEIVPNIFLKKIPTESPIPPAPEKELSPTKIPVIKPSNYTSDDPYREQTQ